jgi:predicted membrane chloride channel (bestrophin family)
MCAARSQWGAIYTQCRMLMARFQGYAYDAPIPVRKLLLRWIIALPYLVRSHLMDYKPGCDSLEHLLSKHEVRSLSGTNFYGTLISN